MINRRLTPWILVVWISLGGIASAWGQTLPAAGNSEHLWLALAHPENHTLTLYHRGVNDPPNTLTRVRSLHGQVAPGALAAVGDTLWMVYTDGSVQTIQAQPGATMDGWAFQGGLRASLPSHTVLRSLAASPTGPWTLVRTESRPQTTEKPQATPPAPRLKAAAIDLTLGLPPNSALSPRHHAGSTTDAQARASSAPSHPTDVLLHLVRGNWEKVALPEDWPHSTPAKMAFGLDQDSRPTLVVQPHDATLEQLWVYRWSEMQWHRQTVAVEPSASFDLLTVAGQLVVAQAQRNTINPLNVSWDVLRPTGLNSIGTLSLPLVLPGDDPTHALRQWAPAGTAHEVALISVDATLAQNNEPALWWTRMDLQGQHTLPVTALKPVEPTALETTPGFMIQVGVLILATSLIITFWRRQPRAILLNLPAELMLAPLGRRALAGVIDLAPGVLGGTLGFGIGLNELYLRWPTGPEQGMTWPGMAPGVVVICIFLVHVTATECLLGRSLGKWIMKLKVTTLDGSKPTAGALWVRNLLKAFDLIAWLLLLLPMIGPYRQRLGDMVAKTVVVQAVQTTPDTENTHD